MATTIGAFVLALLASCGGGGGGGNPPTSEPPGLNPNPKQTWVRCSCGGCSANGRALGTDHLGGCVPAACAATGDLNASCATICASYGLESCTTAVAEPANFCEDNRCEECTTADPACSAGQCNQQAHACGVECQANDGNCSQCDQCFVTASESPGTCLPQNAGAQCIPPSGSSSTQSALIALPGGGTSYLDRYYGRLSVDLDASSSLSFSANGASGSGALSAGAMSLDAVGCPGAGCAVRLNDVLARANSINAQVTVVDIFGVTITEDVSVSNAVITNVKPTTLQATANGNLRIPPRGLEAMVAVTIEGTRNQVRTFNEQDITGFINFTNGAVHLEGAFVVSGANVTFSLNGHATNFAPVAVISAPATVECAGVTTPVAVNGSGSTDQAPGPGIGQFNWFSPFDLATGKGTLLGTTAVAALPLPLGADLVTLQVIDGEGALGLAQQVVTVRDTIAPQIVPTVSQIEVCSPVAHSIALPLPRVVEACTANPQLTGEVLSINGVPLNPPVTLVNGRGVLRPGTLVVRWTARDASGNTTVITQTINVVSRPALYANGALRIDDSSTVQVPGGSFATIVNGATPAPAETNIGVTARVGDVLSRAHVVLRDRSRVEGFLKTLTPITRQSGTFVAGPLFESGPVPLPAFPTLSPPSGTGPNQMLEPGQTASLAPGAYGNVVVKSRATLRLTGGAYRFATFDAEPQSTVNVSKGANPTMIYVSTGDVILRGAFVDPAGGTSGFQVGDLGTGTVWVQAPFDGAIVAPQAQINLASSTAGYTGQFSARDIELGPSTPLTFRAFRCTEP